MAAKSGTIHSFLFLLPLLILSSFPSKTSSQTTTDREKQTLLQIKSEWGNPPALHSWNASASAAPHCNWTGIQCSTAGSVTEISLPDQNLNEPIPAAVCDLKSLSVLDLFNNYLPGPFPIALYNCSTLQYLDLSHNLFVGVIPDDVHHLSPRLAYLSLSANNFTADIPPSIGRLSAVQTLFLDNNLFNGSFPAELGNLSALQTLYLSNNSFRPASIPSEFGNLTALTNLFMAKVNLLGGIPESIGNLSHLVHLDLSMNSLTGEITGFIGALGLAEVPRLQVLSLGGNLISGSIPPEISYLRFLTDLDLSNNRLSGQIPAAIGSLPVLSSLDLSSNQLSGEIPQDIGNLKLNSLNLSSNLLFGEIPASLQDQAYNRSFISNPGLCSTNPVILVNACNSRSDGSYPQRLLIKVLLVGGGAIFFLLLVVFVTFKYQRKRRRTAALSEWKLTSFDALSFDESNIMGGLSEENLIGSGGSGKVYRVVGGSGEALAVKKIWNSRKLDSKLEKEFQAEVNILGSIRHANIVKLLCSISGAGSNHLVYEYMGNGSLDQWLHKGRRVPPGSSGRSVSLDWPTRMGIARGAARGLCYMHHSCSPPIIHRDVKSSNILLDDEFKAKIADFGLARILLKAGEPDSVSAVAGSFGYIAPECNYTLKVNAKMDVYSFGVVLLELVTGRKAIVEGDDGWLVQWAWSHFEKGGQTTDAIDEQIRDPPYFGEIEVVFKLGLSCTETLPVNRPFMMEVLQVLDEGKHEVVPPPQPKNGGQRVSPPNAEEFLKMILTSDPEDSSS